jgi:hypothetical protein
MNIYIYIMVYTQQFFNDILLRNYNTEEANFLAEMFLGLASFKFVHMAPKSEYFLSRR